MVHTICKPGMTRSRDWPEVFPFKEFGKTMLQPLFHFRKFQIRQNAHQLGIIESSVVKPIVLCVPLPLSEPEIQTFIRPILHAFLCFRSRRRTILYISRISFHFNDWFVVMVKSSPNALSFPISLLMAKATSFAKVSVVYCCAISLLNKTSPPLRQRHNHNSFS